MTEERNDYTISDYISYPFVMLIGETFTCLTCHGNNYPKPLKDE